MPQQPQSFWPQAAIIATTIVMITVPGRRAMIIIIMTVAAGIKGGQSRVPKPRPHYITANHASYPRLYQLL